MTALKKLTVIFLVAVLVPSAILATLALKAQEDQEYVIERQRALVHQGTVDTMAGEVVSYLTVQQGVFRDAVDALLAEGRSPEEMAGRFDADVRALWPLAEVGFVTSPGGDGLLAPSGKGGTKTVERFLRDNRAFVADGTAVPLYAWNTGEAEAGFAYQAQANVQSVPELPDAVKAALGDGVAAGGVAQADTAAPVDNDPAMNGARLAVQQSFGKFREAAGKKGGSAFYKEKVVAAAEQGTADLKQLAFEEALQREQLAVQVAQEEANVVANAVVDAEGSDTNVVPRRRKSVDATGQAKLELGRGGSGSDAQVAEPDPPQARALGIPEPAAQAPTAAVPVPSPSRGAESVASATGSRPGLGAEGQAQAKTEPGAMRFLQEDEKESLAEREPPSDAFMLRNTMPLNRLVRRGTEARPLSDLEVRNEAFGTIVAESPVGTVARFVGERLSVLIYYRPQALPGYVFGAQVDLGLLREALAEVVDVEFESPDEICVALLDEAGKVVARSLPEFDTEWSRPFVSTEINEVLPRWEVAAYLVNPGAIGEVARAARLRLGLTVLAVLAAIGIGGLLIFMDYRRQELTARQKTDFVSNVSHELKTPLTSIRMFSDLLGGEAVDTEKRRRYAEVIQGEAGRLTRLINNVLDFSRLERGTREFDLLETDLVRLVRETVEHYRPGLEKEGFSVELDLAGGELAVDADADAVSQVLVNLLSNVEKYGGGDCKEVRVEMVVDRENGRVGVTVCDRGPGVSRQAERRIFERFYRAADSLSSGVQGSGLGLTLARQIAQAHGGEIRYARRDGGGSCFTLELPLAGAGAGKDNPE